MFPKTAVLALTAGGFLLAPDAHATRMATFSASGQNVLGVNGGASLIVTSSVLHSGCSITVQNNSDQSQSITYYVQLKVNGAITYQSDAGGISGPGTTATLAAIGTNTGTNCSSISSCTFPQLGSDEFTALTPNGSAQTQTVACEGWIKVDDTSSSNPGFVTASGTMTTYSETAAGVDLNTTNGTGTSKTSTTTPTNTPIVISEGRPF